VESSQKRISQYKLSGIADFLAVYIQEAHAADEWPVGKNISFCDQHKTLTDRCSLAKGVNAGEISVLVDNMNNDFQTKYSSWPFRFYILYNDRIALKGQPSESTYLYDLDDIWKWLNHYAMSR